MKKRMKYLLGVILLFVSMSLYAQDNLYIGDVFQHYAKRHGSTLVQLSSDVLKAYEISFYKSLTFRPEKSNPYDSNWVIKCIDQDKRQAKKIKETMLDGNLKSGYYQLPQAKRGVNRFILFSMDEKKNRATLIYLEGTLSSAELVTMLLSKK